MSGGGITCCEKKGPEIILEPTRLIKELLHFKKNKKNLEIISVIDVPQENINYIIKLCSQNRINEARHYIKGIYDYISQKWDEEEQEVEDHDIENYDPDSDKDGYDPRFKEDF